MALTLALPYPPSTNRIWRRHGNTTYLTNEGRLYKQQVAELVRALSPRCATMRGSVSLAIDVFPPDRRPRDIDNVVKILMDSLTFAGVWVDDKQVDELRVTRRKVLPRHGCCKVTVKEQEENT